MNIQVHPFNDSKGIGSIKPQTTKLILGSFPPNQVIINKYPRLPFYYGSSDNKFWDTFYEVNNLKIDDISIDNILDYLDKNDFGIIDIIRRCYRKGDTSSNDIDLAIIELQDIIKILLDSKIHTIYTTSKFVSKLFKKQLIPILDKQSIKFKTIPDGKYSYEEIELPANIFGINRQLKLVTLYSPSDNALRGIQKGINIENEKTTAQQHRIEQYRQLMTNKNAT